LNINFENALNAEQLAAVQAPDGPVLVIAAAGTGKTRTLTYRVAWLVERGVDPHRVLLLTFTNRAAREMLERAQALVGERVGGLWGGTFHHMANRMLRRHADAIGYGNDYTILDQDDARGLVRQCADELDLLGKHFPKPDVLLGLISLAANREAPVDEIAREHFEDEPINIEDIVRVHAAYAAKKRQLNAMDFDDLLVNGLLLFRDHPEILARYQERFLYTLVDEYQDTNPIQAEWVDRIAAQHRNLLVVGDDFQSIYSWRGADFRNIMSFPDRYADATVFKLETNYRSLPEILDVANACIAGNPEQFQKNLRAVRKGHHKPRLVHLRDGGQQARYVVQRVADLRRRGRPAGDIVVLYRAHFHAMELQLELARSRIPYVVTSGVRFFEQAHIKDICAIPRLLANPGDELAFRRLLGLLPKVGEKTCARIWEKLGRKADLREPDRRRQLADLLPAAASKHWKMMEPVFQSLENPAPGNPAGELIFQFTQVFYRHYAAETFDNFQRRLEDIAEVINFTGRFETLEAFLGEVALMSNLDAENDELQAGDEAPLKLTTVHQAKGLEWGVVFVLWLTQGMFPSSRALNDAGGAAEERRLFYVATTRAKDELYLCVPEVRRMRDGGVMFCDPSMFVQELKGSLVQDEHVGFV